MLICSLLFAATRLLLLPHVSLRDRRRRHIYACVYIYICVCISILRKRITKLFCSLLFAEARLLLLPHVSLRDRRRRLHRRGNRRRVHLLHGRRRQQRTARIARLIRDVDRLIYIDRFEPRVNPR